MRIIKLIISIIVLLTKLAFLFLLILVGMLVAIIGLQSVLEVSDQILMLDTVSSGWLLVIAGMFTSVVSFYKLIEIPYKIK